MKYIKPLFEDATPSPKPDILSYLVPMTRVARGEQDPDELDAQAQQGVKTLMNWIANAVFTRLYIEPRTYPKVRLLGVEHNDGPTDLMDWLADYVDGDTRSASTSLDTGYLVAMQETGNPEYDALFPEEKYIEINLAVDLDASIRYIGKDWENDELEATYVQCMIAGIWDVELMPDVIKAIERGYDDVPNRKVLMKRAG